MKSAKRVRKLTKKAQERVPVMLRIPKDRHKVFQRAAKREGISLNEWIIRGAEFDLFVRG